MKPWLTVALLLVLSCESPRFPRESPQEVSAAKLTAEDIEIYEALVVEYAENGEVFGSVSPAPGQRRPLSMQDVTERSSNGRVHLRRETNVAREHLELAPDRWYKIDGTRLPHVVAPQVALRDYRARNRRSTSLSNWKPRHLRITRTNDSIGSVYYSVLSLTLPGYTAARDAAVVEVSVSTSGLSGGSELILLRKVNGVWRVIGLQLTMIS